MDVREIVDRHGRSREKLLDVLMECQEKSEKSYLSPEVVFQISKEMNIPESQVVGVASFYSLLSTCERGKYIIQVCNDVPCYISGSMNIVKELENKLGIKMCETTDDGLFTLEFTSCIGCCEMAPAMQIDDKVYGNLTADKIKEILDELRRQ
jgi:NADH-quinone oxidoreductase subunit E